MNNSEQFQSLGAKPIFASVNVFGGFNVTAQMLAMYKAIDRIHAPIAKLKSQ